MHHRRKHHFFKALLFLDGLIFILLAVLAKNISYFQIDLWITRSLQSIHNPFFNSLMQFLTTIGYPQYFILILILTFLYFFISKNLVEGGLLMGSFAGAVAIAEIMKVIIHRTRPSPTLIHQLTPHRYADSFPSGHVLEYLGVFGMLLYFSYTRIRNSLLRFLASAFFLALVIFIGVSRIYLGDHWFSDVLGSYLAGFLWLTLMVYIDHRLTKFAK